VAKLSRFAILSVTLLFAYAGFATTYYIAASGSDSNNGTSKTTPWQHAPGMTGCSNNCAAKTPAPGDQFLLKGGDTWYHSAASTAPTGAPWDFQWSGTSTARIYVGVDKTWTTSCTNSGHVSTNGTTVQLVDGTPFVTAAWDGKGITINGVSYTIASVANVGRLTLTSSAGTQSNAAYSTSGLFCRPVMQGGNAHNATSVSSCAHASTGFVTMDGSFVDLEGLEYDGLCGSGSGGYSYATMNYGIHDSKFKDMYFHGWSHVTFNCTCNPPGGQCDGGTAISVASNHDQDINNEYDSMVVDGFDTDQTSLGGLTFGGFNVHNSIIRRNSQGMVTNNTKYFHDNIIEYINNSSDSCKHSNTWEANGSDYDVYWYNNLIRHNNVAVNLWWASSGTIYAYNNVVYDIPNSASNYVAFDGAAAVKLYNNTFQTTGGTIFGNQNQAGTPWDARNNHFITDNGSALSSVFASTASVSGSSNVFQSNAVANGQGYVGANSYAPTASSNATVGAGANLTPSCASIGSALCVTTTLGGANSLAGSRPASGNWDVGAYVFGGSVAPPPPATPAPPTGLTATPK
jgi:hypothetical protein